MSSRDCFVVWSIADVLAGYVSYQPDVLSRANINLEELEHMSINVIEELKRCASECHQWVAMPPEGCAIDSSFVVGVPRLIAVLDQYLSIGRALLSLTRKISSSMGRHSPQVFARAFETELLVRTTAAEHCTLTHPSRVRRTDGDS